MSTDIDTAGNPIFGIYTKTLTPSPVVRWILHARLRHPSCNDVVLVGDDFLHVKQLDQGGRLHHIATKSDFNSRVRAASVFQHTDDEDSQEDFLIKLERDRASVYGAGPAPHSVVLTLDSNDLVFIFIRMDDNATPLFVQQTCPMPTFDRVLFQPGPHLAIDPYSRGLAVAAREREVILYTSKSKEQIQQEIASRSDNWCPVASQRLVQVDGVIHQMEFLMPLSDDEDHVILLFIVTDQRRTKAVRVEWYRSSGLQYAVVHPGQSLYSARQVPSLLIPLRDASFLTVVGNEITRWENIIIGLATSTTPMCLQASPRFPGVSAAAPVLASWSKPRRTKATRRNNHTIYLAREDGLVFRLTMTATTDTMQSGIAGDLGCHVGPAFASLGDEGGPDILAVAGETSSGKIVSISLGPSYRRFEGLSRDDTPDLDPVEVLPNWASVTDMLSAQVLSGSRTKFHENDNVYITSGRHPFGAITELRQGLEVRLSGFFEMDWIRNVNDVWMLPDPSQGSIIAIFSMPFATTLLGISADFEELETLEASVVFFDTTRRTLACGMTANGQLVQVTGKGICAASTLNSNFEGTLSKTFDREDAIVAASIVPDRSLIIIAERLPTSSTTVSCYKMPIMEDETNSALRLTGKITVESLPLCLASVSTEHGVAALAGTEDGRIMLLLMSESRDDEKKFTTILPSAGDSTAVCDHAVVFETGNANGRIRLRAICGLRDGNILGFSINLDAEQPLVKEFTLTLGYSAVKLFQLSTEKAAVCAMSGAITSLLRWDDQRPPTIESVWVTDKRQPELIQGSVVACAQMPSEKFLSLPDVADHLVMLSGEHFFVGKLELKPSTIPRQIPVNGTPNRLIYAPSLRSFVCASLRSEVRMLQSETPHSAAEEKRQIWPVIDFIPSRGTRSSFAYEMQPGERVYALLPWSLRHNSEKTYSHVLIGGSYIRRNGNRRGRVTLLQQIIKNWEVFNVKEARIETFEQDVYALALYDSVTYIACSGEKVFLYRLSVEEMKWEQVCPPFRLASPGIFVTVETDQSGQKLIVVSTLRDSLVTLELNEVLDRHEHPTARYVLKPKMTVPRAQSLLSHYVVSTGSAPYASGKVDQFTLMSDKHGQLFGLISPGAQSGTASNHQVGEIVFEAQLLRSLTRLVRSDPLERKGQHPDGVASERICASSTDGALIRVVLLNERIWKQLAWLQRLVEWSRELSPHSCTAPTYDTNIAEVVSSRRSTRGLPVGLKGNDVALMQAPSSKLGDLHIDGDVLSRVLGNDGKVAVSRLLHELAKRSDPVGSWVREHLDQELAALDGSIEYVRRLHAWV